MTGSTLSQAINTWRKLLGDANVKADRAAIDRYARTTLPHSHAPGAALLPESTEQVQEIVRIAAQFGVPLYPISRGRNWGYGDAAPPTDGPVIVDLQRMNRIVEVNETLAYAVIEPGVSQQQLYEHLQKHAPGLWMDSTGAGPDASIVGNMLDRGFGHTPCGDHFHNTCGLEIVLADTSVLHTGFGHFPGAHPTYCFPYGVGPVLDGIFSQSNLGIVTRAGIWLNRKPERLEVFLGSAPNPGDLADLIDRIRPLRLDGVLRSAVHVANDLRVMSSRIRQPHGGKKAISSTERRTIQKQLGIGAWNLSSAAYGTRASVKAARRAVRKALHGYRVIPLNDSRLNLAKRVLPLLRSLGIARKTCDLLPVIEPAYDLLKGKPNNEFLRGVLWQVPDFKPGASLDPLDHHVGLIWVSPVAPAEGKHAQAIVDLLEPIYNQHGFDFLATFTFVTERSLCAVTNITFDRRNAEQTARASACYEACMHTILHAGYPPYRTGPGGYAKLHHDGDAFWKVAGQIKIALDPNCILSPSRYIP